MNTLDEILTQIKRGIVGDVFNAIVRSVPDERLSVDLEEDPEPMDTLGTLVDKLITVDLKMWHNQEALYKIRRMSSSEFVSEYGSHLDDLHGIIKRCCDLNVQRSRLMDAIDRHFADVVAGTKSAITMNQHKTY